MPAAISQTAQTGVELQLRIEIDRTFDLRRRAAEDFLPGNARRKQHAEVGIVLDGLGIAIVNDVAIDKRVRLLTGERSAEQVASLDIADWRCSTKFSRYLLISSIAV